LLYIFTEITKIPTNTYITGTCTSDAVTTAIFRLGLWMTLLVHKSVKVGKRAITPALEHACKNI
jgi:hypothetical protein